MHLLSRDDEGFIWFFNSQGIWRFDGTDAKIFDYSKIKLSQNIIVNWISCYDHFIMAFTENNNLHIYDELNDTVYVYHFEKRIIKFSKTTDGKLLTFTTAGQSYLFSRKQLLQKSYHLSQCDGYEKGLYVQATQIDSTGILFLSFGNRVGYLKNDKLFISSIDKEEGITIINKFTNVSDFSITDKYILAYYMNGFVIHDKKTLKELYTYHGVDFAGQLMVNNKFYLFSKKPINKLSTLLHSAYFEIENPLFNEEYHIYGITSSSHPFNYFVATDIGFTELQYIENKEDDFYKNELLLNKLLHKSVRSILRVKNILYIGTYSGFYKYDGNNVTKISPLIVYSISIIDEHTLLAGIEGEIGCMLFDRRTDQMISFLDDQNRSGTRTIFAENGHWYLGASNKIYDLTRTELKWNLRTLLSDSALGIIRQIKRINSKLYVATQKGFFQITNDWKYKKLFPLKDNLIVYGFEAVKSGILLATHGRGILIIDKSGNLTKELTYKDGLSGDYAYSIIVHNNLLFTGCSGGPSIFQCDDHFISVPLSLEDNNGIMDQECNHGAFFYDSVSNKMIFGGLEGLMLLDIKYYTMHPDTQRDKVNLSYVKQINSKTGTSSINLFSLFADKIIISPNNSYISLKFSCPGNFSQAEALMRIKGISDNWQKFKLSEEINLISLPPGKYVLEARLATSLNEKDWYKESLTVEPAFFQSIFFKIIIGLALLLIAYLLWRSRVIRLSEEQQLRTAIASDLHDEIGSTLTRISLSSELLLLNYKMDSTTLKQISDDSKKAISSISDIIWSIDARNDTNNDLIFRMREYTNKMLENITDNIKFTAEGFDGIAVIPQLIRQNLYLIFKESVNNIVKHNFQPEVDISLVNNAYKLEMVICNTTLSPKKQDVIGGQGLRNIKMRAKRMNAILEIAHINNRFTIQLTLNK